MFNASAETWRFAFVFGCGHSATTVMAAMLGAHRRCQLYSEETELFRMTQPQAAENVLRFGLRLVQDQGYDILVEKTPRHVRVVDSIAATLPRAGLIAMVRDPRDVVASFMRRGTSLEWARDRWINDNQALAAAQAKANIFCVRYEDLVTAPEDVCRGVCAYLGIDFDPEMLNFHHHAPDFYDHKTRRVAGSHEERRNRQIHQPLYDQRGIYRDLLSEAQTTAVVNEAAALMRHFGYQA